MGTSSLSPTAPVAERPFRISIAGTSQSFDVTPGDSILAAALRSGIGFPYECSSGGCGSCKFDLVSGDLTCDWREAPGLRPREWERGKRLGCQCIPSSDCEIKLRLDQQYVPAVVPTMRDVELTDVVKLTHDLWEFRFRSTGAARFQPGQYALLSIPGISSPRAYSMCNLANEDGAWHFQIKRVSSGRASPRLFDAHRPGDRFVLDGPYGTAFLRENCPRPVIGIAGGSGLAPMVSIVKGAAQGDTAQERPIHLFYGGREPHDIVSPARLGLDPRINFVPIISEGKTEAAAGWTGARGFVHEHVDDFIAGNAADYEYYLAGPPPMVEAVRRMLILGKSVPVDQIHYDRFF